MIPINNEGNRLDFYLKPPNSDQWSAYTQRAKIHKLCNDFQLSGHCTNGLRCHYDHSPLEPDLKHVLKLIVHDYPCGRRGACRVKDCNLGHVCFREGCRGSSGKGGCRLNRHMHGVDTSVAEWVPAVLPPINGWEESNFAETDDQASELGGAETSEGSPKASEGSPSVDNTAFSAYGEDVD